MYCKTDYKQNIKTQEMMMKSLVFSLISLFLIGGVNAGVDVKLKFHYNNYPLCNWEVRLEHNNSPIGSVVTDRDGVATFSNVNLFSKEVEAFVYLLPYDGSDDWNGRGTVCLNDDYSGEVDFGPVKAGKGSPKAALEKAWNITLDQCENLTPADMHPLPVETENTENEKAQTDEAGFNPDNITQDNNLARIDSLKQELKIIKEKKEALTKSREPNGVRNKKIYKARLNEFEQLRLWTDLKLWIVNTQSSGQSTAGMVDEEKFFKSNYLSARNERESLEHGTRKVVVHPDDQTGDIGLKEGQLNDLRTDMAREKLALYNEQESVNPDSRRMNQLNMEIAKIERKIYDLEK